MNKRLFILLFVFFSAFTFTLYLARHDIFFLGHKIINSIQKNKQKYFISPPGDYVRVTFLDIGQGDASFIEFPDGTQMLVDCAIDARILEALGRVMSFKDRTIDYLVATHPDQDHYGGCVDVLQRYEVKHIIFNGYNKEQSQYLPVFQQAIQAEKAQYTEIHTEHTWTIASTSIHFLYPDFPIAEHSALKDLPKNKISNNTSIVFSLQYGTQKVLFTGDAEAETEAYLVKKYGKSLDSDVLKVGHHGSNTSSGEDFLQKVTPAIAIISAGIDNDYGHPTARVLKRLQRQGSQIWRTDQKGDILLKIDTNNVYVTGN